MVGETSESYFKKQQIINEFQKRILTVEDAIKQINDSMQKLDENVTEVKEDIFKWLLSFNDTLYKNYIHLLRQVDVTAYQQLSSLRCHHAILSQSLGSLHASLKCAENQTNCVSLDNIHLEEINLAKSIKEGGDSSLHSQISFKGPDNINSLLNCGTIEGKGLTKHLFEPNKDLSKCLPTKMEEYDDGDHLFMYKTVEDMNFEKKCYSLLKDYTMDLTTDKLKSFQISLENKKWLNEKKNVKETQSDGFQNILSTDNHEWLIRGKESVTSGNPVNDTQNWLLAKNCSSPKSVSSDDSSASESIEKLSLSDTLSTSSDFTYIAPLLPNLELLCKPEPCNKANFTTCYSDIEDIENLSLASCPKINCSKNLFGCNQDKNIWLVNSNNKLENRVQSADSGVERLDCSYAIEDDFSSSSSTGDINSCSIDRNCWLKAKVLNNNNNGHQSIFPSQFNPYLEESNVSSEWLHWKRLINVDL